MEIYCLDGEYLIKSERYNWTVLRRKRIESGKNAGGVAYRDPSYHGTLGEAVRKLYRRAVSDLQDSYDTSQMTALFELFGRMEEIGEQLEQAVTAACIEYGVTKENIHSCISEEE